MAMTVPKTDEEYINQMYDAKKESTLRTLQSAYDKNVAAVDSALSGLGTSTYEAKRQAAGDAAITRQRLNEQFAANGLNTGAVGQANLALLNQKAANLNAIELKRVEAENQYNAQKAALAQEYQNQVKNAILENDAGRAEALYKAWKEQQAALASGGSGRYYSPKKSNEEDEEVWKEGGGGGEPTITNRHGASWVQVAGFSRLTYKELEEYVDKGKIKEVKNADGSYTYRRVRT